VQVEAQQVQRRGDQEQREEADLQWPAAALQRRRRARGSARMASTALPRAIRHQAHR
jgi:hypothetical protein